MGTLGIPYTDKDTRAQGSDLLRVTELGMQARQVTLINNGLGFMPWVTPLMGRTLKSALPSCHRPHWEGDPCTAAQTSPHQQRAGEFWKPRAHSQGIP